MDILNSKREADKHMNNQYIVQSLKSRDGNCYIVYQHNNIETRLNSTYRPIDEAKKWASQFKITKKRSIIYLFGLGNGYFALELKKKLPADGRLIIIEPSYDIFNHAVEYYNLSDIFNDEKTELFLGENGEREFYPSLESYVHWTNLISQLFAIHPGYDMLFSEELDRYEAMIRQNNEKEIRNRNTEAYFGKKRVENTIRNLIYTSDSNVLDDIAVKIPKDIPAIIVAAGPSLDKNADVLKQVAGKAFIISCDTALRHLYKRGIVPDLTITVDANKPERYFEEAGFEELPVLTTATANYKVLARGKGRKIWFSGHEFQIKLYQKLGKYLSYRTGGGSVATAAFAVCSSLGFKRIVLVGQDLAYACEASHAGGEHSRIRNEEDGITYVMGIDGNEVKTRRDWVSFLQWYETVIRNSRGEFEVIDATEGGALIKGCRIMTLAQVIKKYCKREFNFKHMLENTKTIGNHDKIKQYMKDMTPITDDFMWLCKEAVIVAREGINELNNAELDMVKISQIDENLNEISQKIQENSIYCLADEYARNETMECVQELVNTTDDAMENRRQYYTSIVIIQSELLSASERIKEILNEIAI